MYNRSYSLISTRLLCRRRHARLGVLEQLLLQRLQLLVCHAVRVRLVALAVLSCQLTFGVD